MADTPEVRMRFTADGADTVAAAVRQLSSELQDLKQKQMDATASGLTLGKMFDGLISSAAIYKLVEFGKEAFTTTVELGRLSQQTGVTVQTLSALAVAGGSVGVSQDKVGASIVKLEKNLDSLSQGGKSATTSFEKIGLSAKDFAGLNTDQKILKVMDAIGSLDSGTKKAAVTVSLFGRGAAALIPVMNQVADEGFDKIKDHAEALGRLLDDDTVASFMASAAAMDEIKQSGIGIATQFEAGLMPAIADAADELIRGTTGGKDGFKEVGEIAGDVVKFLVLGMESIGITIAAVVKDAIIDFSYLWEAIKAGGSAVWSSFADAAKGNFSSALQDLKAGWGTWTTLSKDALDQSKQNWSNAGKQYAEADKNLFDPSTLAKNQKDRVDKYKAGLGDSDETDKSSPNTAATEAALKARLAALKAGLENELKLWKDYAKLEADEDKNQFDQGLIGLEAYFSRRRQAIEDEAQKEIDTLMQERDLATKEPSKNDAEKIQNQQKVADLDAKIAEARVLADGKEKALDTELFDARAKGAKTILEYEEQILEAQGKTFNAAILKIRDEAEEITIALTKAGLTPAQVANTVAQLSKAKTASANYDQLKTTGGQAVDSFDLSSQQIQNQATMGVLTQYQAEQKLLALERERIAGLEQIAAEALAAAQATGNPEQILDAQRFVQQIQNMKVAIESANDSWTKFKVSAQNALQSDLANWLGSGINQAKSLGDAFQQLGLSAVKSIQQIAAQMVAQIAISKMIQAIQSVTGWGSGGGSGTGGVGNVATSAAAGMAQAAPLIMASGMMTAAGGMITAGGVALGVSAGELMAAATMLMAANSMSMGMGFASGGYVSGPGSSTSDSISARLSDGEFVVRAAAVKAIGVGTLAAINRGIRTPSIVSGFVPRFADGGLVQASRAGADGELRLLVGLERGLILKHLASKEAGGVIVKQIGQNAKATNRAIGKG